jgi:hypothetical protein
MYPFGRERERAEMHMAWRHAIPTSLIQKALALRADTRHKLFHPRHADVNGVVGSKIRDLARTVLGRAQDEGGAHPLRGDGLQVVVVRGGVNRRSIMRIALSCSYDEGGG